ncbi:hypothetical protein QBC47DRAFT_111967 [Echria macrotheca]|uniref:Uncharacterized protein n=1 Tax=Echria macrotheca TaxID=438768 RepID=A0AAJ0FF95_9PEZI|nr:hypothetical protein QBC47DRAFT_111967 [Echria macrotheca]
MPAGMFQVCLSTILYVRVCVHAWFFLFFFRKRDVFAGDAWRIRDFLFLTDVERGGEVKRRDRFQDSFPDGRCGQNPRISLQLQGGRFKNYRGVLTT